MFRMRIILNTDPKIWNNLPKYAYAQNRYVNLKEILYPFTTHSGLLLDI